jgi:cobalt-zinc-cadmium efflux system outer membrane protein
VRTERAPQYQGNVVGIDASIPIFLFNDYSGDIARAAAERDQAAAELDRIRGQVRADIERAAAQLAAALDRSRRIAAATLPEARRAAEAITFAFGRGAATLTDLFDATRQFASVRTEDVFARADLAKALVAYREALAAEESP